MARDPRGLALIDTYTYYSKFDGNYKSIYKMLYAIHSATKIACNVILAEDLVDKTPRYLEFKMRVREIATKCEIILVSEQNKRAIETLVSYGRTYRELYREVYLFTNEKLAMQILDKGKIMILGVGSYELDIRGEMSGYLIKKNKKLPQNTFLLYTLLYGGNNTGLDEIDYTVEAKAKLFIYIYNRIAQDGREKQSYINIIKEISEVTGDSELYTELIQRLDKIYMDAAEPLKEEIKELNYPVFIGILKYLNLNQFKNIYIQRKGNTLYENIKVQPLESMVANKELVGTSEFI